MIIALSRRIQRLAQKRLVHLSFSNAMGFGFITGQTIYLIALMYGANDTQMGLLYAAPFATALAALFVPVLLNRQETTAIWSRFWWMRTMLCLGYFALPFMGSPAMRVWSFVLLYYLFMTTRSFGMAGYFTVVRALAPPRDNASLMARTLLFGQFGVLLAQTIGFVMLTSNALGSEERNLFALVAIGILFNAITARQIGRLPKTGYLDQSSMRSLGRTAREIARRPEFREVAIVACFQAAMSVFAGYLISYLRNVAGFSGGQIFLFTVTGLLGAISMSNLLRMIGPRIRERIILLTSHTGLAVLSVLWAATRLIPGMESSLWMIAMLYALTVIGLTASTTVALQLRTGRLPSHHSVEYSIVYDMAQVAGACAAIVLARYATRPWFEQIPQLHPYSLTFLLWSATCITVCLLAMRMRSGSNSGLRQEFAALLPSSIFTIIRAHRLDQDDNLIRRHLGLEGILQNPNQISRELILEHLQSPDAGVRGSCMRVLNGYPMLEALPTLLTEAASPFSPLRAEAITAIGFAGHETAIPALWELWDPAPPAIRATLVKSLLRLGADIPDERIREVWAACPRQRRTDILIGVALIRHSPLLLELLGDELRDHPDPYWTRMLFGIGAAGVGLRESMFEVFAEETRRAGSGFDYILANVEDPWPPALSADACRLSIGQDDYNGLTTQMRQVCKQPWVQAYDRTTALGVLFLLLLYTNGWFEPGPLPHTP